jgi:hypothetical protein
MIAPTPDQMAACFEFSRLAAQYHATGRFAAITGCIPVAGNLLHHALEMYLKCTLIRSMPLAELKALGHRLPALWDAFCALHPEVASSTLLASLQELDKLEQLRYPNVAVQSGYQMSMTVQRAHFGQLPPGPQPPYHLVLEDVDQIASVAAQYSGLEPSVFSSSLRPDALHYLLIHNLYPAGVA